MGYTIVIGNAVPENCDPDEYDGQYRTYWRAERVELPDAPKDGSPTDGTNERWPSYSNWSDFADNAGLYDFFFDKDYGVMHEHPGCFRLTKEHLEIVEAAQCSDPELHGGRLAWLKFWVKWAVENCDKPCIYNS